MRPFFHIHGVIRVEYRVRTRALGEQVAAITNETRLVGGSGALCALALARLGARVHLSGNALGDDSHGRFVRSQLEAAHIQSDLVLNAQLVTPYAILLRCDEKDTITLLSPEARQLVLPPPGEVEDDARLLDFSSSPKKGEVVAGESESYSSLLRYSSLLHCVRLALQAWLEASQPDASVEERNVKVEAWVEELDQGFGEWPF